MIYSAVQCSLWTQTHGENADNNTKTDISLTRKLVW